jgi:serine protease Do
MKMTLMKLMAVCLLAAAGGVAGFKTVARSAEKAEAARVGGGSKPALAVSDTPIQRDVRLGTSYSSVVKKAAPSVVSIFTSKTVRGSRLEADPFFGDDLFRRFFGDRFSAPGRNAPRQFKERGLGSGVIVTKDGYILTNNHVVDGADEVKVLLAEKDKKEYVAKIVGRDPKTDVAVLKVEAKDLPAMTLADSDKIEVGDVVLAIGNPFGIGQAATMGIISAIGRGNIGIEDYEDFIQTDAAVNPGNSGGALVDVEGRLIGINTAILSRSGGNMGVGFAVPINLARGIMDRLMQDGKVVRGYLGVVLQDLTADLAREFKVPETGGVLVGEVMAKSPAAEAGLKHGDVIIELNAKPVKDSRSLRLTVAGMAPGAKIELKVLRDGKERSFNASLKELPENPENASLGPAEEETDALDGVVVTDLDAKTRTQLKLPADLKGAVISSVDPNSASYDAGLREGDVVLEINRKAVTNAQEAVAASKRVAGGRVLVRVWSKGASHYVVVDEGKKR